MCASVCISVSVYTYSARVCVCVHVCVCVCTGLLGSHSKEDSSTLVRDKHLLSTLLLQLLRQYLYFCTSKASNLSGKLSGEPGGDR